MKDILNEKEVNEILNILSSYSELENLQHIKSYLKEVPISGTVFNSYVEIPSNTVIDIIKQLDRVITILKQTENN